jgi:hypothetical protein
MTKTFSINGITITWDGSLTEKIRILESLGITYTPTPAEIAEQSRKDGAKSEAALATQFKTLTPQQAVNYIENSVVDLPSAKAVLKIMARILIAMRDEIWPDLPEG